MHDRPKLGEILVQAGVIDELQLASALGEQRRWGRRLGVTLIKLGMVEEAHLMRALAKQLDLPIATLQGKRIAPEVLALVPPRMASEHGVIPLFVQQEEKGRGRLYLGMEDPSDIELLDDLSFRTGLEIRPVMVTPSDLGAALDRYYHARPARSEAVESAALEAPAPDEALGLPSLRSAAAESSARSEPEGALERTLERAPEIGPERAPEIAPEPEATRARNETGAADTAGVGEDSGRETPIEAPKLDETTTDEPKREPEPEPEPEPELELDQEVGVSALPEGLLEAVAGAVEQSERTRLVAKALTQLLIEKGILDLAEIQAEIVRLKSADPSRSSPDA